MVERGEDAARTGDELSPAEVADRIAQGLAQLAKLVERPEATGSLPAIAAQLRELSLDQAALVVALSLAEAPQPSAEQIAAEAALLTAELGAEGAAELLNSRDPVMTGKALADREPLTWRRIPQAVERLATVAAAPMPNDASPAERAEAALDANAARQLARLVPHLGRLVAGLGKAAALHQQRDGSAPSVEATAEIALGLLALLDGLHDLAAGGAKAPVAALLDMLASVQTGQRPRFSRSGKQGPIRATPFRQARVMGQAACALDARMQAGERMSNAAMAVAAAVRSTTGESCLVQQVTSWREQCMEGARGLSRGFPPDHPAMMTWATYQQEIVARPDRRGGDDPAAWMRVVARYESTFAGEAGGKPQLTDRKTPVFRLDRKASSE